MIVRSPLLVGAVATLAAGLGLAGCNRGGTSGPSTSSAAASSSQAPATLDANAAKTASCVVVNKAIDKARTANDGFVHAVDDPKRVGVGWNKAISDAADNAAVIFAYVAKDLEGNAIKPQLDPALVDQVKQLVQLSRDRTDLLNQHSSTDVLNENGEKWDGVAKKLSSTCQ